MNIVQAFIAPSIGAMIKNTEILRFVPHDPKTKKMCRILLKNCR